MMAPAGSKGEEGPPISTTNPVSLPVLFHVTLVPGFTQNSALALGFSMLAVEDDAFAVLFTSTTQGLVGDPQLLSPLHSCAGFGSEQAYLLLFWAAALFTHTSDNNKIALPISKHRLFFITHLSK
jgi:hypothetical protein